MLALFFIFNITVVHPNYMVKLYIQTLFQDLQENYQVSLKKITLRLCQLQNSYSHSLMKKKKIIIIIVRELSPSLQKKRGGFINTQP